MLAALTIFVPTPALASWGHGTAQCAAQNEASAQTSLACTLGTANLEAGNIAVVACAGDNSSTTAGATNVHGVATDSGGNTYTKLYEYTQTSGAAADGVTISLHFAKLATGLTSGTSTITCNYGASVTDRAMHLVGEFTLAAGMTAVLVGTPQGENGNVDAGALTISGLTSKEYLFVRAIGVESNAAVSMTATGSYSLPDNPSDGCNNTATGGEATDTGACSEYRIFTGTGDTSNPTLVDVSNDNASVYVALSEVANVDATVACHIGVAAVGCTEATYTGPSATLTISPVATGVSSQQGTDHPVAAAQSMQVSPAATTTATRSAAAAQAMTVAPAADTQRAMGSAAGQALTITPAAVYSAGFNAAAAQTLQTSPAATATTSKAAQAAQGLQLSPAATTQSALGAAASQALQISPVAAISAGRQVAAAQTLQTSPSATAVTSKAAQAAQALQLSPAVGVQRTMSSAAAQGLQIAPTASTQRAMSAAAAQALHASPAATGVQQAGQQNLNAAAAVSCTITPSASTCTESTYAGPAASVHLSPAATASSGKGAQGAVALHFSPVATVQRALNKAASVSLGLAPSATGISSGGGNAFNAAAAVSLHISPVVGCCVGSAIPGVFIHFDVTAAAVKVLGPKNVVGDGVVALHLAPVATVQRAMHSAAPASIQIAATAAAQLIVHGDAPVALTISPAATTQRTLHAAADQGLQIGPNSTAGKNGAFAAEAIAAINIAPAVTVHRDVTGAAPQSLQIAAAAVADREAAKNALGDVALHVAPEATAQLATHADAAVNINIAAAATGASNKQVADAAVSLTLTASATAIVTTARQRRVVVIGG